MEVGGQVDGQLTLSGVFQEIEQLYADGVTSGCGGENYCPEDPVTWT